MEYIAIPKSEFVKHFKIIEAKKGTIRSLRNETTLRKSSKRNKKSKRESSRSNSTSDSSDTE